MEYKDYIEKLATALEIHQALTGEEALEEIEDWDSLKLLSFIAFADSEFGRQPKLPDLKNCLTIRDLYNLLLKP
jgi:acyl carrier protein